MRWTAVEGFQREELLLRQLDTERVIGRKRETGGPLEAVGGRERHGVAQMAGCKRAHRVYKDTPDFPR